MRTLLVTLAFAASASASTIHGLHRRPLQVGFHRALSGWAAAEKDPLAAAKPDLRGGAKTAVSTSSKPPPAWLKWAYSVCGLATTAAWTTVVLTTIRSNQPAGMMMPTAQHGLFARVGALSAVPLIAASFARLASASRGDSWEPLSSPSGRRHNLAVAAAGAGSALWVGLAPIITQIPGTDPRVSHQAYRGAMRAALMAAYGSAAALGAAVWARSLPEEVRRTPLAWPGRIADGVARSLVSLAPANRDDPVDVKYALLASGFLFLTGLQLLASHPTSVIPSWTGRRLARAFPAWTLLAAVASYDLKEAAEDESSGGKLLLQEPSSDYRTLSNGLRGFGTVYLGAKVGAVFLDPSFPQSYHAVAKVPGWAVAAILMIGLTLRPDQP